MISRYNAVCQYCRTPTIAGKDEYDLETKTSFHPDCRNNLPWAAEADRLADQLGFISHGQPVSPDWFLRKVPDAD